MSEPISLQVDGKVAFVTGSTRGIGWATAQVLAAHGAHVILNARTDSTVLSQRVEELRAGGRTVSGVVCDVASPSDVRQAFQGIFKQHRRLDVLVNNAGILEDNLIGMIGDDAVERTFDINALGTLHCIQAAARLMTRHRTGSIVNVSSIVGVNGNAGQLAYSGSKAAVIGMTRSAAKELAPSGVRVNAIAPGFIDTDMTRRLPPAKFAERTASIAMGRLGTPEDVARVVLFLASDLAAYVTGQVIGVDGGMLI